MKTAVCNLTPRVLKTSSTFIGNCTAIRKLLKRISKQFTAKFEKKKFCIGIQVKVRIRKLDEIYRCSNMNDMVFEYHQYQDTTAEDKGGLDEEEEADKDGN